MKALLFIFGRFLMCNAILAWCCLKVGSMSDDVR